MGGLFEAHSSTILLCLTLRAQWVVESYCTAVYLGAHIAQPRDTLEQVSDVPPRNDR